jgi:hypothetical protein
MTMKNAALALSLTALVAIAANPAFAGCGGHGKSYRAAQAAKPTTAKKAEPQSAPAAALPTTEGFQTTAAVSGLAPASTEL